MVGGGRLDYEIDNQVPSRIGEELGVSVSWAPMVLEGRAVEVNGKDTLMATRSSIINPNRNPGKTQRDVEEIMKQYLGVKHFIWQTGAKTDDPNIGWADSTDTHIDTVARFVNESTILYAWAEEETEPRYSTINFPRPYGRGISSFQTSFALHLFSLDFRCMLG